jgi:hypothetical protein
MAALVLFMAANKAKSEETTWELRKDSTGYVAMFNESGESLTSVAVGYQGSRDCTDVKVMFANYFPAKYPALPANQVQLMGADGVQINLPARVPRHHATLDATTYIYMYTPSVKMIEWFLNTETFQWRDGTFKEGEAATHDNGGFAEALNAVMQACVERTGEFGDEPPPEGEEIADDEGYTS